MQSVRDPGAAVDELLELVKPLGIAGVDCIVSERLFTRWGQSNARHIFHHSGFPADWHQRWPRYAHVDPLLPATAKSMLPVEISQLRRAGSGSALQHELWDYLASSGLDAGTSVPVHLPGGAFAAIAFFHSESQHDGEPNGKECASPDGSSDRLFMVGQFFCRALAQRFALVPDASSSGQVSLSDREVECLYWTSVGKTTEEIALIIGRATQTVRFHLDSAARKLGAVNRASAVAQACSRGIITPH